MKTHHAIALIALMVVAVVLGAVSVLAYSYGNSAGTGSYGSSAGAYGSGNYPNGMMSGYEGMMGGSGMMGGWTGGNNGVSSSVQNPAVQNAASPILGLVAVVGGVIAGTGGLAYFLAIPKIKKATSTVESHIEQLPQSVETPYVSVSKTLTAEERQVLDSLVSHEGKYLQKYIRAETGLSRLKTHRIVARLAERGIVVLEKSGNTNEVSLSSWLQNSSALEQPNVGNIEKISISN